VSQSREEMWKSELGQNGAEKRRHWVKCSEKGNERNLKKKWEIEMKSEEWENTGLLRFLNNHGKANGNGSMGRGELQGSRWRAHAGVLAL